MPTLTESFPPLAAELSRQLRRAGRAPLADQIDEAAITRVTFDDATLSGFTVAERFTVLSMQGAAGVPYFLQVSTNLATLTVWETIATNVAPDGLIQFVDPQGKSSPARFYRTLTP